MTDLMLTIQRIEMKGPLRLTSVTGGKAPISTTTPKCILPPKAKARKRNEYSIVSSCDEHAKQKAVENVTDAVPNSASAGVKPAEQAPSTCALPIFMKNQLPEAPPPKRLLSSVVVCVKQEPASKFTIRCYNLSTFAPRAESSTMHRQPDECTHTIVASSALSPAESHDFFAKVPLTPLASSPTSSHDREKITCTRPRRGSLLSLMISESEDEELHSPWMAMVERRRRLLREKRRMETDEEDPLVPMPLDEYEALTDGEGVSPILGSRLPSLFKFIRTHSDGDSSISNSLIDPAWRIREMQRMHVSMADEQTRMNGRKRGYHKSPGFVVDHDVDAFSRRDVYEPDPVLW
ncbi:hypothetical protein BJ742DRAFT_769752 [Cladochytrium replicatum]|nr:hypothetical protein BJ742DRAFT_769752 [Cladochytrium replicatum]